MWHVRTVEYYSAIKRKKVLVLVTVWMNLEHMLSERSQIQKPTYSMVLLVQNVRIDKRIETVDAWLFRAGAGGWRKGERGCRQVRGSCLG